MRRDLMAILVCPVDKATLTLTAEREDAGEIVTGTMECTKCHNRYLIKDTIPNLLPPEAPKAPKP